LQGHSSMSINVYTFYKKKIESLHAQDGILSLENLSDIICQKVINNRNAQQIDPVTMDNENSSDEDNNNDAKESVLDPL